MWSTSTNNGKVVALAKDVDILFIEAALLQANATVAAKRDHPTAHQAGTLARQAGTKRLVTLHYSPRHQGRGEELAREAEVAFRGGRGASPELEKYQQAPATIDYFFQHCTL